jgi:hypothetical protein
VLLLAVDAAQIEDVETSSGVRAVGLLVVDETEAPFARKQNGRQVVQSEVAVSLLEDRASIDDAVDVGRRRGEATDRRTRGLRQERGEFA